MVNLLREMKAKLSASLPLVHSLVATQGDHFHHSFLQSAIQQARAAGIQVTSGVDNLLAVRRITALADAGDWTQFVIELRDSSGDHVHELREAGILHALESLMRSPIGTSDPNESVDTRNSIGLEKIDHIQAFLQQIFSAEALWSSESLSRMKSDLEGFKTVLDFTKDAVLETGELNTTRVQEIEKARTMISAKGCKLFRCMTTFPCGMWLGELVQDKLAEFHSQNALLSGLAKAFLAFICLSALRSVLILVRNSNSSLFGMQISFGLPDYFSCFALKIQ